MSVYVRAYEGNEPYIFVSYAHRDSERVLPVIRSLYDKKYRVWYDEGIAPGSEWPQNIARHLNKASAVIIFVSEASLGSPNCKNEVRLTAQKDKMILVLLDEHSRRLFLSDKNASALKKALGLEEDLALDFVFEFDENLTDNLTGSGCLGPGFIGDGITGYQYSIDKKRSFNFWNVMLGFAAVLAVVFAVALYGLYNGWFDELLPAKQPVVEAAAPTARPQEAISIGSNIIGSVLPVEFSSEEEKNAVYGKLGWSQPSEMTYNDLIGMNGFTHLDISNEPIYDISFAAYLPDLEEITLSGARITDLEPLIECPKLKTVRVTADMLPLTLPEIRDFEIEVI